MPIEDHKTVSELLDELHAAYVASNSDMKPSSQERRLKELVKCAEFFPQPINQITNQHITAFREAFPTMTGRITLNTFRKSLERLGQDCMTSVPDLFMREAYKSRYPNQPHPSVLRKVPTDAEGRGQGRASRNHHADTTGAFTPLTAIPGWESFTTPDGHTVYVFPPEFPTDGMGVHTPN